MTLLWNLGLGAVPRGRGVLLLDRSGESGMTAHLTAEFLRQQPRMNLYLPGDTSSLGEGQSASSASRVHLPWPVDLCRRRWLTRLKIDVLIELSSRQPDQALLRVARTMDIHIISVDVAAEHAVTTAAGIVEQAGLYSVPGKRPVKKAGTRRGSMLSRNFTELASTDALAARLQRPGTIMCLGNGPSSEDSALGELTYDALFRVNHSWQERKQFDAPDVVFTAQHATLKACRSPAVFVFQTLDAEHKVLRRAWTLWRKLVYLNAERAGVCDPSQFAPYKPTNGAVMIATAVALAPARLIVAGIDLFSDPRGAYPGDQHGANAYTPAHDREIEARFILATLRNYPGEVKIIGDALLELWQSNDQTWTRNGLEGRMA